MNKNKQLTINLITSMVAFVVNMGISFFLTPYITKNIGVEAYGFVSLGTNFINYASLATIALNSMAGRFITIEIHKDNWENTNKYFNSVLLANVIVAGVMLIPSILFVTNIEKVVNIPEKLLYDVKLLFAFLFGNYLVGIIVSPCSVSTFATNKLYLSSLRQIESTILKAVIMIVLFVFFKPAVSYLGFTTFMVMLYTAFFNIYYVKKFLPQIIIDRNYFNAKAVLELISSGIWNTIIRVGQILLDGMDLLISNLFINPTTMGILALSKTIPSVISSLVGIIAGVFIPEFTILYAKNNIHELLISIKWSMKILGIIVNIPIAILVAFGEEFFTLWVPHQDPKQLQILSIITLGVLVVSGSINSIYGIFTVTNRIKPNAIVLLLTGIVNVGIVFVLLNTTNLGVYAIVIVSTILGLIRNLAFTAPFGAKCLGLKWNTFFPEIIKSVISFAVVVLIGIFFNHLFIIDSWGLFIVYAGITGVLGLIINILLILNKSEKEYLVEFIRRKIKANK